VNPPDVATLISPARAAAPAKSAQANAAAAITANRPNNFSLTILKALIRFLPMQGFDAGEIRSLLPLPANLTSGVRAEPGNWQSAQFIACAVLILWLLPTHRLKPVPPDARRRNKSPKI
jgi:hypothetical protein